MLIVADGVGHDFGALEVLDGISLSIARGEVVAVVGPSGSGKSTLLAVLAGLLEPTRGSVHRRDGVTTSFVFQRAVMLPRRSVLDNVAVAAVAQGFCRGAAERLAHEALASVGLAANAAQRAASLSGGQMQRLAVARSTVCRPDIVFADEPTAGLDERAARQTVDALRRASVAGSVVAATHDVTVANACDRSVVLR